MSRADLTADRLRELLHYDPETGVFTWLKATSRRSPAGTVVCNTSPSGIRIGVDGNRYLAHRLAWLYVTGAWPVNQIDHVNGDRLDNRWQNLRDVCNQVNQQNVRFPRKHGSSGWLGVTPNKNGRFTAYLTVDGRTRYLGRHGSAEQAHQAYLDAKRRLHEGCTL